MQPSQKRNSKESILELFLPKWKSEKTPQMSLMTLLTLIAKKMIATMMNNQMKRVILMRVTLTVILQEKVCKFRPQLLVMNQTTLLFQLLLQ